MENNTSANSGIKFIIITAIICILLCLPLGILIGKYVLVYDKNNSTNTVEKTDKNVNGTENVSSQSNEVSTTKENKKMCSTLMNAKYYGEYADKTHNVREIHTVTFKDDGTFEDYLEYGEPINGTYTIKDNILTTYTCPALGPCEQENKIEHAIADDCSYIKWGDSTYSYNINLQ